MEAKLEADELANISNRVPGGGSSGRRASEESNTGIDGESWIVFDFTFSPADTGAVVIRMMICLMLFRLVFVF